MPRIDTKQFSDRIFTVPNALSLLRLFMVPIVVALLLGGADGLAAALFVLAALTDFLDGRIARLALRGLLPAWAVAILVGRDLLALLGSLVVGSRIRVNWVGKAATAVLMVAVAFVVISPGKVGEIMFYAGFVLSVAAGLLYVKSLRQILGDGGEHR
jgi:cardiolipin synthase (CMP-forming)